jgi:HD domain-containing protein
MARDQVAWITSRRFRTAERSDRICKGTELLRAWGLDVAAEFVAQHHEHVNGSGYSRGLAGDDIALEARIIHVADAYVAMTLDRAYRPGRCRPRRRRRSCSATAAPRRRLTRQHARIQAWISA